MAEYLCHGCSRKTSNAYQCDKCSKILCSSCKSSSTCKDNPKGTAGCNGQLKRLP